MNKSCRLVVNDVILNSLIVAACIAIPLLLRYNKAVKNSVTVYCGGKSSVELPLGVDTDYSPDGGHTVIRVKDGKAYVLHSDCPDGLCMKMQPVTQSGGSVVCLPNKVSVTLSKASSTKGGADVAAG